MALTWQVQDAMYQVYPYAPRVHFDDNNVIRTTYSNVELAAYIRKKATELNTYIQTAPRDLQRSYLRAFFDDEGCVSFEANRNKRRVRGYQHDRNILELIHTLLRNFGIESTIDKRGVELIISRKQNLIRFRDEIGFSPGVYVNGARKNSVWKQSLEKRVILDRAIASYLPQGTPGVTKQQ